MNRFWEWMQLKNYYEGDKDNYAYWILDGEYNFSIPTEQMLIGYMIEYLIDTVEKEHFATERFFDIYCDINQLYDNLVRLINNRETQGVEYES